MLCCRQRNGEANAALSVSWSALPPAYTTLTCLRLEQGPSDSCRRGVDGAYLRDESPTV